MIVNHHDLELYVTSIFEKLGSPVEEAKIVAHELVGSNLCGMDSHGVVRVPQYAADIAKGNIVPGAPVTVLKETDTTAIVDFGSNFGQVGAMKALEIVAQKAEKFGIACVVSRRGQHVGRFGSYTDELAKRGYLSFGLATLSYICMAPWGGREGRLGTNPISFAAPAESSPVVMDMATSGVAMGKVIMAKSKGEQLPEGFILDKSGKPATNPDAFFDDGSLMPMGGLMGGHKGSALAVMAEAFGAILAGEERTEGAPADFLNTFFLLAINPDFFCGKADYSAKMEGLKSYLKSSAPAEGFQEVLAPGEMENNTRNKRLKEGIYIPDGTWKELSDMGEKLGIKGIQN